MDSFKLVNIDPEDLDDIFLTIETSFGIEFSEGELKSGLTFGEFCTLVQNKIIYTNTGGCTSQQAFYKLRSVIKLISSTLAPVIHPDSLLHEIFPIKHRRKKIKDIEDELGFKLKVLEPYFFITILSAISFIVSLFGLYFSWMAAGGIALSFLSMWIANLTANQFNVHTVGELSNKMILHNYILSRRNKNTFNKNEVNKVVQSIFIKDLDIEVDEFQHNSVLIT